ncbi:MAG: hypothetical protein WCV90_08330 [Candidatus Woesearchaeota archaeon]
MLEIYNSSCKSIALTALMGALVLIEPVSAQELSPKVGVEQRIGEVDQELNRLGKEKDYLQHKRDFDLHLNNAERYLEAFVSDNSLTLEEQRMISSELKWALYLQSNNPEYQNVPEIWKTRYDQMKENADGLKLNPFRSEEAGLEQELRNHGYPEIKVGYNGLWNNFALEIGETFLAAFRVAYWGVAFLSIRWVYRKMNRKKLQNNEKPEV